MDTHKLVRGSLIAVVVATSLAATSPTESAPKTPCQTANGTNCCPVVGTGNNGNGWPPHHGGGGVLDRRREADALMAAFDALQSSNPAAYQALASTLDSTVDPETKDLLSSDLGMVITKDGTNTAAVTMRGEFHDEIAALQKQYLLENLELTNALTVLMQASLTGAVKLNTDQLDSIGLQLQGLNFDISSQPLSELDLGKLTQPGTVSVPDFSKLDLTQPDIDSIKKLYHLDSQSVGAQLQVTAPPAQ